MKKPRTSKQNRKQQVIKRLRSAATAGIQLLAEEARTQPREQSGDVTFGENGTAVTVHGNYQGSCTLRVGTIINDHGDITITNEGMVFWKQLADGLLWTAWSSFTLLCVGSLAAALVS